MDKEVKETLLLIVNSKIKAAETGISYFKEEFEKTNDSRDLTQYSQNIRQKDFWGKAKRQLDEIKVD